MRAFWNILKHRYFKVSAIVTLVIMLPLFLLSSQQKQEQRSLADNATTLSFSPSGSKNKPVTKNINDQFTLDVVINPGNNLVSLLKLDINYDPSVIELSPENPMIINKDVFPEVLEGPVYSDGRVQVVLSVGFNQTKAVSTQSTVATLNFISKSLSRRTTVNFGDNLSAFSVGAGDASGENIIGTATPAYIRINGVTTKGSGKNNGNPNR